jgi:hypothetical protein
MESKHCSKIALDNQASSAAAPTFWTAEQSTAQLDCPQAVVERALFRKRLQLISALYLRRTTLVPDKLHHTRNMNDCPMCTAVVSFAALQPFSLVLMSGLETPS